MIYVATRAYYADCPTCDSIGDPQLVSFTSLEDFLKEYSTTCEYKYNNLYSISPEGVLKLLAELSDNCGSHHVTGKTIDVVGKDGLFVRSFDIYTTSKPSWDYFKEMLDCLQEHSL